MIQIPQNLHYKNHINSLCKICAPNCSKEDAQVIFRDAAAQNMTEAGYVWIVTEQALNAKNVPDGALGLRLLYAEDEQKHLRVR